MVDCVHLIVFNADVRVVQLKGLHDEPNTADDLLAVLQHQTMVCGNVRFALRTIDNNGICFAHCGTDFDVGGETRAAHTGAAGLANDVDDLLGGQRIHIFTGLAIRTKGVLEVIFDYDRKRRRAAGSRTGLHCHHSARNTGVDGGAKACGLANLLADRHRITFLHHGLTGGADVHGHRDDHLSRGVGQRLNRFLLCRFLMLGGVNAAVKHLLHKHHLCFSLPNSLFPQKIASVRRETKTLYIIKPSAPIVQCFSKQI